MGRSVNHHDVQDKMIFRNKIIADKNKPSKVLSERDPGSLSMEEQEMLIKEKLKNKIQGKSYSERTKHFRISHRK